MSHLFNRGSLTGISGDYTSPQGGKKYDGLPVLARHNDHIFDKLGVSNRVQATVRARELGLL